jgi:hypothetical protein
LHTQAALEPRDPAAHRGGRDPKRLCRSGEAAMLRHRQEDHHLAEPVVHQRS